VPAVVASARGAHALLLSLVGLLVALAAPVAGANAASVTSVPSFWYQAGSGESNDVSVSFAAGSYTVTDSGLVSITDADGAGGCAVSGNQATCPDTGSSGAFVDLGDGNDAVTVTGAAPNTEMNLHGGPGDDELIGGPEGDAFLGGTGADTMRGGDGADIVDNFDHPEGITADIGGGANDGNATDGPPGARDDVGADIEALTGTFEDDTLGGDAGANELWGLAGNDTITSRDSVADTVDCGDDTDTLIADTLDVVSNCEQVELPPSNPPAGGGGAGGGGSPTPPPDKTPPDTVVSSAKAQRLGRSLGLRVSCPAEACTVTVTGSVSVPNAAKVYKLKAASAHLPAGAKTTLRLAISAKARAVIKRALKRGKKVKAKLRVVVKDSAGNTTRKTSRIALKR
jgi:Ca2+-binding RTX toxin-like protein